MTSSQRLRVSSAFFFFLFCGSFRVISPVPDLVRACVQRGGDELCPLFLKVRAKFFHHFV